MDKLKLKKNINDYIIFSDFDGTISIQDVNDELFKSFGGKPAKIIENKFKNNIISEREALKMHYNNLNISKNNFEFFIKNSIKLDPYFNEFYKYIKKNNVNFAIISGGFLEYIKILLKQEKIEYKEKIYANNIDFKYGNLRPLFLHDIKECEVIHGPCGNCKYKLLQDITDKKIIYIGDGLTDRCVTKISNYLFVKKNSLLEYYCRKNNIEYISFNSFKEIKMVLDN